MKIIQLRANKMKNPIGYSVYPICLSWKVIHAKGIKTEVSRVCISKTEDFKYLILDSGLCSDLDSKAYCPDISWEEDTQYYWRVYVKDDKGEAVLSESAWFRTAKKTIKGNWIKAPFDQEVAPLFFRSFKSKKNIREAYLYISGLGLYEAYLNGEKIGDEFLTPGVQDYQNWIQFNTYDVKDMIKKENCLGIMLGSGWYKGRFGFDGGCTDIYGDTMQLKCQLHIVYEDDEVVDICSDDQFACIQAPVTKSNIYDGEIYDACKEIEYWNTDQLKVSIQKSVLADDSLDGRLVPRKGLPMQIQEHKLPVEVIHTPLGETVLDFGQNMAGWVSFEAEEPEGTEIILQYGEVLQEGNFYRENLRTAKAEFRYRSNGRKSRVRPHFTYYGFRYVKVIGMRDVKKENFQACVLHSTMERKGWVDTSNEKINRLFENCVWGLKSNFIDIPTDCPQRDERMGWTGDAQIFSRTAAFNMDVEVFFNKYLYEMRFIQEKNNGIVSLVVPDVLEMIGEKKRKEKGIEKQIADSKRTSCAWGDAATIIPWNLYLVYGNQYWLKNNYVNMKMWIDYIRDQDDTIGGGQRLWTTGNHLADWLALDNFHKDSPHGATDPYFVASIYYYYSALLTSRAAKYIGYNEESKEYNDLAEEIKQAIQSEYFTSTGRLAIDTQTAYALVLYFDIAKPCYKERIIKEMKKKLEDEQGYLTTGFIGTHYLCPALTECGLAENAYTLLFNEAFPSWLYQVNMGATTIWERWNSILEDGRISGTEMNSLNHYAYGSIIEWMYQYMCGIKPVEESAGFLKFVVKPYPDQRMKFAKARLDSPYGIIESGWNYEENNIIYNIIIPFETQAEFILTHSVKRAYINKEATVELLKEGKITLNKGEYEILIEL